MTHIKRKILSLGMGVAICSAASSARADQAAPCERVPGQPPRLHDYDKGKAENVDGVVVRSSTTSAAGRASELESSVEIRLPDGKVRSLSARRAPANVFPKTGAALRVRTFRQEGRCLPAFPHDPDLELAVLRDGRGRLLGALSPVASTATGGTVMLPPSSLPELQVRTIERSCKETAGEDRVDHGMAVEVTGRDGKPVRGDIGVPLHFSVGDEHYVFVAHAARAQRFHKLEYTCSGYVSFVLYRDEP